MDIENHNLKCFRGLPDAYGSASTAERSLAARSRDESCDESNEPATYFDEAASLLDEMAPPFPDAFRLIRHSRSLVAVDISKDSRMMIGTSLRADAKRRGSK
jgi:hypothetical protein